jgi:hypothetical protein
MSLEVEDYFVAPVIEKYSMFFRLRNPECNLGNPFKGTLLGSNYKSLSETILGFNNYGWKS